MWWRTAGAATLVLTGLLILPASGLLLGPPSPKGAGLSTSPPGDEALYGYSCAADDPSAPGPCFTILSDGDAVLSEPAVAYSRTDPSRVAVAVNRGPPLTERLIGLPRQSYQSTLGVFVSQDGGRAWTSGLPPLPQAPLAALLPNAVQSAVDASIAFDDAGRLHLVGLALSHFTAAHESVFPPWTDPLLDARVFYTRSDDLGASWTPPLTLDDYGGPDRPWLTVDPSSGTLVALWQNVNDTFTPDAPVPPLPEHKSTQVAWSRDAGTTWTVLPDASAPRCGPSLAPVTFLPSPAGGSAALFSCSRGGRIHVYELDFAAGSADLRNTPWPASAPRLYAVSEGGLVLVANPAGHPKVNWSVDGGYTWSEGTDLISLAGGEWTAARVYAAEADARGALHVVVRAFGADGGPIDGSTVHHLVLTADDGLVHRAVLSSWPALPSADLTAVHLRPAACVPIDVEAEGVGAFVCPDDFWGAARGVHATALTLRRGGEIQLTFARALLA